MYKTPVSKLATVIQTLYYNKGYALLSRKVNPGSKAINAALKRVQLARQYNNQGILCYNYLCMARQYYCCLLAVQVRATSRRSKAVRGLPSFMQGQ